MCYLLKSYYVLRSLKTVSQNFVKMVFSGPDVPPNSSLCAAHRILSIIWFRNASINNFSSMFKQVFEVKHRYQFSTQSLMLLFQKLMLAHGQQDATAVPWQTWLSLAPVVLVIKPKSI